LKFYSLNKQSPSVDFKEATIRGQAPDKGLYFPERIPQVEQNLINEIEKIPDQEIALEIIRPYVGTTIPEDVLYNIIKETIHFPIPLVKVNEDIYSLELFHGPTLAFKDIGAKFMSRCLGFFSKERKEKLVVLVATSGDTGGAVANGFYGVAGVEVVILYPSRKVSAVQEKQLTSPGRNIHALEVKGSFDDCQQLVKQAFADKELNQKSFLTSANSINVARWLPQQFYYFFAWKQWGNWENPPVISVPSGNFGNICAGLLAHASGLPVQHFIAACNANDTVPEFLQTGNYKPKKAIATLSNAMDVGEPGNFIRVMEIFHQHIGDLKKVMSSTSISDAETIQTIKKVNEQQEYLLDPHGAVGFLALQRYLNKNPGQKGIFLETAHPVKFADTVESFINRKIDLPPAIQDLLTKKNLSVTMDVSYSDLKDFLNELK
jgi:threonine synthase